MRTTTTSTTVTSAHQYWPNCRRPSWIGDGECDPSNNVAECNFDGGDCGEGSRSNITTPGNCRHPERIADGKCDTSNNVTECSFDGGDCCQQNLIGNDICDEFNNFVSCGFFDGWDCPISETNLIDDEDQGIDTP